jgi:hypothetical protein
LKDGGTGYSDLNDAHEPQHEHDDYDGDNQTEDTAHIRSLQDVSDDLAQSELKG